MPERSVEDFEMNGVSSSNDRTSKSEKIALMKDSRENKESDSEFVDVELEESGRKIIRSNGQTDEKEPINVVDGHQSNQNHDSVLVDDRMVKETIVTIDTTDKKLNRKALRSEHTFAAKKTVAQGMMDVALITANANQLRYLVEFQRNSPTFYVIVFLIIVSLLLQIAVGVSLIFKGRFDIQGKGKSPQARRINNHVVVGVFLITIINVFVAAFSVSSTPVTPSSAVLSTLNGQQRPPS